jgi:hypothetical protein
MPMVNWIGKQCPNIQALVKVDFATANWEGERRRALVDREGPEVWIAWVVL